MDIRTHAGTTYEMTIVALAHEPGFSVELADLSGTGGIVAEAFVRADVITLVHQSPLPAEIYSWWADALVELARSQAGADPDE